MSTSNIICSHCNSNLQIQEECFGLEIECPVCKCKLIVNMPFRQSTQVYSKKQFHAISNNPGYNIPPMQMPAQVPQPAASTELIYCQCCKNAIYQYFQICPFCKTINTFSSMQKSKTTFALLGIFLGLLGVHNIYAKRWVMAAVQFIGFFIFLIFFLTTCDILAEAENLAEELEEEIDVSTALFPGLVSIFVLFFLVVLMFFEIFAVNKDGNGIKFKH